MRTYSRLFAVLWVLFFPFAAFGEGEDMGRELGNNWLRRCEILLNQGQLSQAREAWLLAEEFSLGGSDAFYLSARLRLGGFPPRLDSRLQGVEDAVGALADLESAFLWPDWDVFEPMEPAKLLLKMYLRLRRHRSLLQRYQAWPAGWQIQEDLMYPAAQAALALGLKEKGRSWARRLLALRPEEGKFRALAAALGDTAALSTLPQARLRYGETVTRALEPYLLREQLPREVQDFYAAHYPDSPLVRVFRLLEEGQADSLDFLGDSYQYSQDGELLKKIYNSGIPQMSAAVKDYLADFTGDLTFDADWDGYNEETLQLVQGSPRFRRVDQDQDGLVEILLTYDSQGIPDSVIHSDPQVHRVITYDPGGYPGILNFLQNETGLTLNFVIAPGQWLWDPFEKGLPQGYQKEEAFWVTPALPPLPLGNFPPGTTRLMASQEIPGESMSRTVEFHVLDDQPVFSREHRLFHLPEEGSIDWGLREVLYEEGLAAAGRRSFTSGIWELYERYEKGVLTGVAWDPGMEGTPEYLRDWALGKALEIKAWDRDRDGWFDLRLLGYPQGRRDAKSLVAGEAERRDLVPWQAGEWAPWEN